MSGRPDQGATEEGRGEEEEIKLVPTWTNTVFLQGSKAMHLLKVETEQTYRAQGE